MARPIPLRRLGDHSGIHRRRTRFGVDRLGGAPGCSRAFPDTSHYLEGDLADPETIEAIEAIEAGPVRGTGGALAVSALTSIVAFGVMTAAPAPIFASLGELMAVMILLSAVVALLVLPCPAPLV